MPGVRADGRQATGSAARTRGRPGAARDGPPAVHPRRAAPRAPAVLIDEALPFRVMDALAEINASLQARQVLDDSADAAAAEVETARARVRFAQTVLQEAETET